MPALTRIVAASGPLGGTRIAPLTRMRCVLPSVIVALALLAAPAAAQNTPPVADAGTDQDAYLGDTVVLQGAASDPDGDRITDWLWTIESMPPGSTPLFQGADTEIVILQPDMVGDYVIALVVSDGMAWSAPDSVTVGVDLNQPPTAAATADVHVGVVPLTVNFDGTGSVDPEGRQLDFLWIFGDGDSSTEVSPSHVYMTLGTFTVTLRVTDDLGQMDTDSLTIIGCGFGSNCPPVADAGDDQTVFVGQAATLEGTATDPDRDPIVGWMWAIESSPPGSNPSLSRPFSSATSFTADLPGDYEISLISYDGMHWGLPDTVVVTYVENLPPSAVALAYPVTGTEPLTVHFDATQSFDPENGPLVYLWEFGDGTPPVLEADPVHTYASRGNFLVLLQVHDDFGQMDSDFVEITVLPRVVTQPATDSGRYSFSGSHNSSDTEYEALVGGSRSFFVFDLKGLTDPRPIASASLLLDTGTVSSGTFGGITYTLYDVSTPIAAVTAGGSGLTAIYDDLGTGVPYSAATEIEPGTSNTDKSILLLPAGVAAVEAAMGGMLAIGGGPTGRTGNLAFSGTDVSGARLVIEFEDPTLVPVLSPAAVTLLATLLAGMGFATLRIHRRRGVY